MGLSRKQVSSDVQDQSQGLLQSSSADSGSGSEKLKCPRCDSANTKFCYYNNYNKSQPRYLCKGCKRHWTKGGMLRDVPVGGGKKKKNKRLKTSPNTTPKISITNALQGTSFGLDGENTMRKTLNEGPQYLLQDTIFNSNTNQDLEFTCPSLEYNFACNSVDQTPHLYALNNGASNVLEETEMTLTALDDKAWLSYDSSTNWGWDEMDKFVISDVTIPWDDDAEIN